MLRPKCAGQLYFDMTYHGRTQKQLAGRDAHADTANRIEPAPFGQRVNILAAIENLSATDDAIAASLPAHVIADLSPGRVARRQSLFCGSSSHRSSRRVGDEETGFDRAIAVERWHEREDVEAIVMVGDGDVDDLTLFRYTLRSYVYHGLGWVDQRGH